MMGGNNVKPANRVWWIPVVSDRGERFPNAKAAATGRGQVRLRRSR